MELSEAIKTRRSVKEYLQVKVEHEKVMQLLEAAQFAPSAGNLQNWGFVVIRDGAKRESIAHACLEQLWMTGAPVHIFVGVETKKAVEFYGSVGKGSYAYQNGAAAMMLMALKATELGLSTCWVGAFNERMLRKILGFPDDVVPIGVLTVGYTQEQPKMPLRTPLEYKAFFGKWGSKSTDFPEFTGEFGPKLQKKIKQAKEKLKTAFKKH